MIVAAGSEIEGFVDNLINGCGGLAAVIRAGGREISDSGYWAESTGSVDGERGRCGRSNGKTVFRRSAGHAVTAGMGGG